MECFWCSITKGHLTLLEHEAAKWLALDSLRQVDWLPADLSVIDIIEKEDEVYDISVHVRYTPYITEDEIKFKMKITSPSSIVRESVHTIKLKDKEGKEWLGDALGDMIDLQVDVKTFYTFIERGLYKIELVNMGQKYQLQGIMELGLEINQSNLDR
jgi:gliding motility-associated lipoprotein GldH